MSKVTGIPMVPLAVDIALGDTLASKGYASGIASAPTGVAVKAPAFSTAKLRGVDPTLGPFMQSTGEVIGLGLTAEEALGKALIAANLLPPPPRDSQRIALLSIADRDKHLVARLATPLLAAGYELVATPGTRSALAALGIEPAHVIQPVAHAIQSRLTRCGCRQHDCLQREFQPFAQWTGPNTRFRSNVICARN